ncbi:hypothetical protein [Nocardia sp. SC052]|uniref:hypothetical protein n=1 Tax=Nocardia sichangensis TaxID=3385975 RepID=UPI0039A207FC
MALNLRARSRVFARLATGGSAAVAVFVLCALVYINSKSGELKAMTARRWDMGGQLGSVMSWILGKDKLPLPGTEIVYSSASLAPAGIFACIVSLGGALAAVAQWIFVYSPTSIRRPQRSPADAPASPETDL